VALDETGNDNLEPPVDCGSRSADSSATNGAYKRARYFLHKFVDGRIVFSQILSDSEGPPQ
jgi:hypothetical protein